jgi:hypothetical protein
MAGMMPAAISRRRSMVTAGMATAPNGRLPLLLSASHVVARLMMSRVFS